MGHFFFSHREEEEPLFLTREDDPETAREAGIPEQLMDAVHDLTSGAVRAPGLCYLLNVYYQTLLGECDVRDAKPDADTHYPAELSEPVAQRASQVEQALSALLGKGFDPNESAGFENALMIAVRNADAPMSEYLLKKGADVTLWPGMSRMRRERNLYFETVDIRYTESCILGAEAAYLNALVQTARVLAASGRIGVYLGITLRADGKGGVSFS